MKKYSLIIGLWLPLLLPFVAFAQVSEGDSAAIPEKKITMTMGKVYANDRANTFVVQMMRDQMGNIYMLRNSLNAFKGNSKSFIEKYTPDLKQVFDTELVVEGTESRKLRLEQALTFANNPYLLASYYNKSTEKKFLFALRIGEDGMLGTPQKICEYEIDKKGGDFTIKLSKDSSKLLIAAVLPFDKKEKEFPVSLTVLDTAFKEIWKVNTAFPSDRSWGFFSGEEFSTVLENFSVDNKGRVHAIMQVPRDDEKSNKMDSKILYKLYIYEDGSNEPKKIDLDLDKKVAVTIKVLETSDSDEIIAVGTYSNDLRLNMYSGQAETNGVFFFKINTKSGTVIAKTANAFNKRILDFMTIDSKDLSKGKGIEYVSVRDYWITDKNNVVLSLEQTHGYSRTDKYGTTYYYFSDVMFNIKYDPSGKVLYQTYIPKSLNTITSDNLPARAGLGLYYLAIRRGEDHALVFNDHRKNLSGITTYKDLHRARPGSGNTIARMVSFDEAGKKKGSILFSNKDEDFVLQSNVFLNYAPGAVITLGIDGKKFKLIKISY